MEYIINSYYKIHDNILYISTLFLIFIAVVFIFMSFYYLFQNNSVIQKRLSRLIPSKRGDEKPKSKLLEEEDTRLIAKFTKPLHRLVVPDDKGMKKKLRLKLIQGGFRSERALQNFISLKIILFLALPTIYLSINFVYGVTPETFLISLCTAFAGYLLPDLFLHYRTQIRKQKMLRTLPDALDLMVVCVESGLGLDMTFKKVGEEIRPMCKELSDEFHLTNLEIRAGKPRNESFRNMSTRTDIPEIHNLLTILIQTSRFGTSVAQALKVHADAMRIKRRQNAELRAAKSTVKLVFPLVVFIFPAIFVVIVGPAAIRIAKALLPVLGGG